MKKTLSYIGFIFVLILTITAAQTFAATFTVTKSTDSNDGVCDADCSLREAVFVAQSGDTILFNSNLIGQTFTLGGTEIVIVNRITIDGNIDGVNVAFISGAGTNRIFRIASAGGLDLRNAILVQGGGEFTGGAIRAEDNSVLLVNRVAIRGNVASDNGGAIWSGSGANVHIINSSISSNVADRCSAVTFFRSTVDIANTTISGNRHDFGGGNNAGAICSFDSELTIRNSTIAKNVSERSTLIITDDNTPGFPSVVNLGNTIIADNEHDFGADIDNNLGAAQIVSVGGNLIGTTVNVAPGTFTLPNDTLGQNPLLAPTNANQGGHPITTHPLQAGSPALNTGINALAVDPLGNIPLTTDARGITFPRIAGATVDKGAFEDQTLGSTLVVSKIANSNDNVCDTDCSLREAVFAASQDPGTDNITMAANVFGTMNTGGSEIFISNNDVNIIGYPILSADTLIISGGDTTRIFRITNSDVSLTGLTLADGNGVGPVTNGFGGALFASGGSNLTLDRVIVRNNAAATYGALYLLGGTHRILNSTIHNNQATACIAVGNVNGTLNMANVTLTTNNDSNGGTGAGALCNIDATASIRNSTISFNRIGSDPGAGIWSNGTLDLGNTVVTNNIGGSNTDINNVGGTVTSVGGNLVQDTNGFPAGTFTQPSDQTSVDPQLMTLGNYGGNVTTHALAAFSPAANSGLNANAVDPFDNSPLLTDARGQGFPRMLGTVDKGAFERLAPSAASVSVSGRVLAGKGGVPNALVTITDMSGQSQTVRTSSFGEYRFDGIQAGQSYFVTVSAKQFQFGSHAVTLTDDLADLDFYAVE